MYVSQQLEVSLAIMLTRTILSKLKANQSVCNNDICKARLPIIFSRSPICGSGSPNCTRGCIAYIPGALMFFPIVLAAVVCGCQVGLPMTHMRVH